MRNFVASLQTPARPVGRGASPAPAAVGRKLGREIAVLAAALLLVAAVPARAATEYEPGSTWTIQGENDRISTTAGGSDKFYTSGLRLGWTSGTDNVPDFARQAAQVLWGDGTTRISFNLTHQIYSPTNTTRAVPDPRDRPVAGYFAGTLSLLQDTDRSRNVLALTLGVIGPSALGRQVQNGFHKLIRSPLNNGWGGQLPDEPAINLLAERTWRLGLAKAGGLEADILPSLTLGVGTVRNYVQSGFVLRLGQGLDRDFGVARLRPGLTGGDAFAYRPGVAWYAFTGINGEVVARDAFLDGSLWKHSANVRRNWLLGSMQAGVAVIWGSARLSYTQTWQTQSFRGQRGGLFNFGSLALSVRF